MKTILFQMIGFEMPHGKIIAEAFCKECDTSYIQLDNEPEGDEGTWYVGNCETAEIGDGIVTLFSPDNYCNQIVKESDDCDSTCGGEIEVVDYKEEVMAYKAIQLVEWLERDTVRYIYNVREFRADVTHTPKGRLTSFFAAYISDATKRQKSGETVSVELVVVDSE